MIDKGVDILDNIDDDDINPNRLMIISQEYKNRYNLIRTLKDNSQFIQSNLLSLIIEYL